MRHILSVLVICVVPALARADEPKLVTYPAPEKVRASFLNLLERPKPLFNVKNESAEKDDDGLVTEKLSFASEKRPDGEVERVPVLLMRPEKIKKKLPTVIVLHGTGGSKEGQKQWLAHLAKRGMIG